jgi:hypothetical protein
MATSSMTTYELETLFIEKLTEKYNLTERSIKKAFSRFDSDGNGLLNLAELVTGFEAFLNGVSHKQVQALVFSYDVNGDGVISFEEFFQFLTNRQDKQQNPSKQAITGGNGGGRRGGGGGGGSGGRPARQGGGDLHNRRVRGNHRVVVIPLITAIPMSMQLLNMNLQNKVCQMMV